MLVNSLRSTEYSLFKKDHSAGSNKLDTGFCIRRRCSQKLRRQWTLLMFNEVAHDTFERPETSHENGVKTQCCRSITIIIIDPPRKPNKVPWLVITYHENVTTQPISSMSMSFNISLVRCTIWLAPL